MMNPIVMKLLEAETKSIHSGNVCPVLKTEKEPNGATSVFLMGHCLGSCLTDVEADNLVHAIKCFGQAVANAVNKFRNQEI